MRESKVETTVWKYARSKGFAQYKFVSPMNRGVPDRLFIYQGNVFFIEFKAPGKKRTKLQDKIARDIEAQGIRVFEIDNIEDGIKLINKYV